MQVIMRSYPGRTTPDALFVVTRQDLATKVASDLTDAADKALSQQLETWDVTVEGVTLAEKCWNNEEKKPTDYPIYYVLNSRVFGEH